MVNTQAVNHHHTYELADLRPGEHLCSLYRSEVEHRALVSSFAGKGLEQGDKVLYIVDVNTAETIVGYLRDERIDVTHYLDKGQLVILTHDQAYTQGGAFDAQRMIAMLQDECTQSTAQGYPALRVTGEMTWALRGLPGSEQLIEYETRLNEFLPHSCCIALCQYDMRRFSSDILLDVLRTHPVVVLGTEAYDNPYYVPPEDLISGDLALITVHRWLESLIERKRNAASLAQGAQINAAMAELSQALLMASTPEQIAALVLEPAMRLTGSAFGYVGYIDPETGYLVSPTLSRDIWEKCQVKDKNIVFERFSGLWGWVLTHRQPLLSNDAAHDERASGVPVGHVPIQRFLSAPAIVGDTLYGQIALANPGRDYEEQDLFLVQRLALLYALAVQRWRVEQERMAQIKQELVSLERLSAQPNTTVASQAFGQSSLRDRLPGVFDDLIQRFDHMLEDALEQRAFKVDKSLSLQGRQLAGQLGALRAGPRDMIEIYITAVRDKGEQIPLAKRQAYVEEGRLIALEMMGYLVAYYRDRCVGIGSSYPVERDR